MKRIVLLGAVLSLVVVASALAIGRRSGQEAGESAHARRVAGGEFQYPDEWKTTLDTATVDAAFTLVVPSHPNANIANVTAVYLWPDRSAVALRFPSPMSPATPIRQEYIEVWESPWTGGDPSADFAADLAAAPVKGKDLYDINGIPALGVTAHSPSDLDQRNPAFLRFVYEGIEFEISGGEDLNLLIEIAKTIVTPAAS